jgi:hypothetical protein
MRYFKRHWGESRGDAHNAWGCSLWYFETDGAGVVTRQQIFGIEYLIGARGVVAWLTAFAMAVFQTR